MRSASEWKKAFPVIASEKILGFDTETRPTFRRGLTNPPALVQLATLQCVYLIQLYDYPFSAELAGILANPGQIKAGVAIRDDMLALAKLHPFEPGGIVDLGQVAKEHGIPSHGLRTLAAAFFNWRISKASQCSNWTAKRLSARQVRYAATDAWAGRLIYLKMLELGLVQGPE